MEMSDTRDSFDVLLDSRFWKPFFACLILQPLLYFFTIRVFPSFFMSSKKQRAWILTFYSSAVMSAGSIPFLISFFLNQGHFVWFGLSDTGLSIALCAYFMSYLIVDLLLGSLEYSMFLNTWSGWFHHSLYTILTFTVIKWRVGGVFCTCAILEAPTFIMSMGAINSKLRRDKLFGAVFFLTRILLHVYFVWRIYWSYPSENYHWIGIAVFPLHAMWFNGWIKQQSRLRARKNSEPNADTKSSTVKKISTVERKPCKYSRYSTKSHVAPIIPFTPTLQPILA